MTEDEEPGGEFASPPCSAHELEDQRFAGMDTAAVVAALNRLLEGERAGARGLRDTGGTYGDGGLDRLLAEVGRDEARYCAMLTRHIERLGGTPSLESGVFYDKLLERPDAQARLRLLDRGQKAVVEGLNELLGQTLDRELRRELVQMRDAHQRNIAHCAAYLRPDQARNV